MAASAVETPFPDIGIEQNCAYPYRRGGGVCPPVLFLSLSRARMLCGWYERAAINRVAPAAALEMFADGPQGSSKRPLSGWSSCSCDRHRKTAAEHPEATALNRVARVRYMEQTPRLPVSPASRIA